MTVHFTAEDFRFIELAICDTIVSEVWAQGTEEDPEWDPDTFMENVIRNDDGSVDVPDHSMPELVWMLRELHCEYAESVLYAGWTRSHNKILIEDYMQDLDWICLATSAVMENPDYILLMMSYRRKEKRQTKGETTK